MKTRLFFSAIFTLLIFYSCQKEKEPTPVAPREYQHAYSPPGKIDAIFVDTVSLSIALSFVSGLGLTPFDFSHFQDDTVHWGTIGVPVGSEMLWVDSLNTYKLIIKQAAWVAIAPTFKV